MQVKGGYGVWRLCTDYRDDKDFEQDIFIEPVYNPFAVKFDAAATKQDKSDANFVFYEDLISKEDFEHRWPDKSLSEFETDTGLADWLERGLIRVCEYWYKKPIKDTMWALSDGRVLSVDELYDQLHLRGLITEEQEGDLDYMRSALAAQGVQVVKEREVDSHEIVMRITNGKEWLSEECEFPSKYFPFVPVYSNYMVLEGKEYWHGLVRPNKDGQRLHNVHRTAAIEAVAKALSRSRPKSSLNTSKPSKITSMQVAPRSKVSGASQSTGSRAITTHPRSGCESKPTPWYGSARNEQWSSTTRPAASSATRSSTPSRFSSTPSL